MKRQLLEKGFSAAEIKAMSPGDARRNLGLDAHEVPLQTAGTESAVASASSNASLESAVASDSEASPSSPTSADNTNADSIPNTAPVIINEVEGNQNQ